MRRLVIVLMVVLTSCSPIRKVAIDISEENMKNAETMKEVSQNCISVWPIQSGFIKGALGNRINELPKETVEAIEELDRLAQISEPTDYEIGLFLGLKINLMSSTASKFLERYAPGVVQLLFW